MHISVRTSIKALVALRMFSEFRPYTCVTDAYDSGCIKYGGCAYRCFELSSRKQDFHVLKIDCNKTLATTAVSPQRPPLCVSYFISNWMVGSTTVISNL